MGNRGGGRGVELGAVNTGEHLTRNEATSSIGS